MSKPMTLNEIAIDDEMNQMRDRIQRLIRERDEARADNARLTARVEELKSVAQSLINYRDHNTLNFQLEKADDYINLLRDYVSSETYASQPATLTPRNCETCRKAAEEMRKAAAVLVENEQLPYIDLSEMTRLEIEDIIAQREYKMADDIRALPLPSFGAEQCAGCAPLKPE